jgi:hypothetical protein
VADERQINDRDKLSTAMRRCLSWARGLDEASRYGWVLVDMTQDWKTVFPER